jgi:DivIVA domain-containing protein
MTNSLLNREHVFSPEDITKQTFTDVLCGYAKWEVDQFLKDVAQEYELAITLAEETLHSLIRIPQTPSDSGRMASEASTSSMESELRVLTAQIRKCEQRILQLETGTSQDIQPSL